MCHTEYLEKIVETDNCENVMLIRAICATRKARYSIMKYIIDENFIKTFLLQMLLSIYLPTSSRCPRRQSLRLLEYNKYKIDDKDNSYFSDIPTAKDLIKAQMRN